MQRIALEFISKINNESEENKRMFEFLSDGYLYMEGESGDNYSRWFNMIADYKNDEDKDRTDISGDYRLKRLAVRDFRRLPKDNYYGLEFCRKDKKNSKNENPCSLIVLGSNGSGKSTLYSAMEYKCTGEISEAKLRNVTPSAYMQHNENEESKRDIQIETDKDLDALLKRVPLNTFFCSEYNLIEMSKLFQDFDKRSAYVPYAELMGLHDVVEFIKMLDSAKFIEQTDNTQDMMLFTQLHIFFVTMSMDFKESAVFDYIKKGKVDCAKDQAKELIDKTLHYIKIETLQNKLKKSLAENTSAQTSEFEIEQWIPSDNIITELNSLFDYLHTVYKKSVEMKKSGFSFLKEYPHCDYLFGNKQSRTAVEYDNQRNKYVRVLENGLISKVNRFVDKGFTDVVKGIMEDGGFIDKNDETIVFKTNKNIGVKAGVRPSFYDKDNDTFIPPAVYFNTFRLRLFCLCVRMAAACKLMQDNNVVFPIVYDDIFYSSDYEKRAMLRSFFLKLYEYYLFCANKYKIQTPQLIFFTHDEQIFNVVENTLPNLDNKEEVTNVIYGRLLGHEYATTDISVNEIKEVKNLYVEYV